MNIANPSKALIALVALIGMIVLMAIDGVDKQAGMMNPNIDIHNAETGEMITREMTDEEYAELLATGWTPDPE